MLESLFNKVTTQFWTVDQNWSEKALPNFKKKKILWSGIYLRSASVLEIERLLAASKNFKCFLAI